MERLVVHTRYNYFLSVKIVLFFFSFINQRKTRPLFYSLSYVTPKKKTIPVQGTQEVAFQRVQFTISWGGGSCPRTPPRSSYLRHSTFVPVLTVHVRQLNHCFRYFQMLPKTLSAKFLVNEKIKIGSCMAA